MTHSLTARLRRQPWPKHLNMNRRDFLRLKRRQSRALIKAIEKFRRGCAYLPPAEDRNAGGHMCAIVKWIKGPCRKEWRKA